MAATVARTSWRFSSGPRPRVPGFIRPAGGELRKPDRPSERTHFNLAVFEPQLPSQRADPRRNSWRRLLVVSPPDHGPSGYAIRARVAPRVQVGAGNGAVPRWHRK